MKEEIDKALEVLKNGGVILYPTDTVWGLGCDATNADAVQRIYDIKQRSDSKSMIILLENEARLNRYIKEVPDLAWDLIELSEEPLTIVYPGATQLAPNAIANDGTVAIRITRDEFCSQLIRKFNKPIVSTSANLSGEATPYLFRDISTEIKSKVDYIVNLRQNDQQKRKASTIIKLQLNGEITILRK